MEILLAFVVGGLYAAGLYLLMRRSIVKLIIGLGLLGHAANLLIFTVGRLTRGRPPLIAPGATLPAEPFGDPLPQALILTAIVIGFGVQAFALVLIKRSYQTVGTDDLDGMKATDIETLSEYGEP
jgi:multicomponent Na+:H+ antiporter subunit C